MTGSDLAGAFSGFAILLVGALLLLPLGLWKLAEIVIWLCHHIHFSVT